MKKFLSMVLVLTALVALTPVAVADTDPADIGWIKTSTDSGATWNYATEYNDDYGHRVWATCSKAWFPDSEWNTRFSAKQRKIYETKWVDMIVHIPTGAVGRLFTRSYQQTGEINAGGYVYTVPAGSYHLRILNGEFSIWEENSNNAEVDLIRIWDQAAKGNINTPHALDLAVVTEDLKDKIPAIITNAQYIGTTPTGLIAD